MNFRKFRVRFKAHLLNLRNLITEKTIRLKQVCRKNQQIANNTVKMDFSNRPSFEINAFEGELENVCMNSHKYAVVSLRPSSTVM